MSLPVVYHTVMPDLSLRATAQGGDGRTIYGIAVPYNKPTYINPNLTEMFLRGTYAHQVDRPGRAKLARNHLPYGGILIGAGTLMREDPAGLYTEFRVAKTPVGDETLELYHAGALDEWSIGFVPVPAYTRVRQEDGVTVYSRADLREVAIVLEGAYGREAVVAGVRQADDTGGQQQPPPPAVPDEPTDEAYLRGKAFLAAGGALPALADLDDALRRAALGLPRAN